MSHRREKRARQAARLALMTAVSFDASLMGHAALADPQPQSATQPAKTDELQEIMVTGYRLSLETALETKRNSELPIESISQEDIGKMPDQNVAESLQRLPGIQIDRSGQNGQGTSVLIDGLRQNLTTLNGDLFLSGKEFYVSGEASGGGAGSNSQYSSLETIPSELVIGIDVIKNPNASITEGGLGGTINLKTLDPLHAPQGLSLAGVANESKAQSTNTSTPQGVLIGSFKVNDSLSFTASVGYDKELTHTKEFQAANRNAWIFTDSAVGPYTGPLQPADITRLPQYYIDPQLAYFTDIEDQRVQKAAAFGVGWKITDSLTTNFNYLFAKEDETTYSYSDKAWFNGQGSASGSLLPGIDPTQSYSIDPNGVVQQGTFNANGAETASLYQSDNTEANNFQWITKFDNGSPIRGIFDAAFSRATCNLQAAQADVEHGLYTTSAGVATSPAAPGCNNGASTCAPGTGTHGYEFNYNNGGTLGLALGQLSRPLRRYPEQSGVHDLQIELGVGQLHLSEGLVGQGRSPVRCALHHRDEDDDHGGRALRRPRCGSDLWPLLDQWDAAERRDRRQRERTSLQRQPGHWIRSLSLLPGSGLRQAEHSLFHRRHQPQAGGRRAQLCSRQHHREKSHHRRPQQPIDVSANSVGGRRRPQHDRAILPGPVEFVRSDGKRRRHPI